MADSDTIEFRCKNCPKVLRVAASSEGKRVRCPSCKDLSVVPFALDDVPANRATAGVSRRPAKDRSAPVPPPAGGVWKPPATKPGRLMRNYYAWFLAPLIALIFVLLTVLSVTPLGGLSTLPGTIVVYVGLSLAGLCLLAQPVLFFVMMYKLWQTVQDDRARCTPGQAVGYWFIPFFNLYWMFVATAGLARELNRHRDERDLDVKPALVEVMEVMCALPLMTVPVVVVLVLLEYPLAARSVNAVSALALYVCQASGFRSATNVAEALVADAWQDDEE